LSSDAHRGRRQAAKITHVLPTSARRHPLAVRSAPPPSGPASAASTLTYWARVGVPGAAHAVVVCPRRRPCRRSPRTHLLSPCGRAWGGPCRRRLSPSLPLSSVAARLDLFPTVRRRSTIPATSLHLSHIVCSPCMLRYIYFCSCLFLFWSNARCVYDVSR
jgi:hypothetical protein